MNILLTGGAGYIGSKVAIELLKKTLKWKPKFNSIKTMINILVKWEKKL
jgi:UDP-glucose 4-epimerase